MARDRQRAKQRQAARRAERLEQRRAAGPPSRSVSGTSAADDEARRELIEEAPAGLVDEEEIEELADLEVGAPPEDVGRVDAVDRPDFDTDTGALSDDELEPEEVDFETDGAGARVAAPAGRRAGARQAAGGRNRLVAFLIAVWAELRRVQWPNFQQLTQLTGVVLFFVIVIGAYLGGLDAIFSKLIQAIL